MRGGGTTPHPHPHPPHPPTNTASHNNNAWLRPEKPPHAERRDGKRQEEREDGTAAVEARGHGEQTLRSCVNVCVCDCQASVFRTAVDSTEVRLALRPGARAPGVRGNGDDDSDDDDARVFTPGLIPSGRQHHCRLYVNDCQW